MSDIVAQLEVLSQESGCLLDLTAILDLSICPKIDLKTPKHHKVEEKEDVICVTPSQEHKKEKRCPDNSCYEVSDKVCKKSHVALDLELLVILGLLTEEELEKYLKAMGEMDEDDSLDMNDDDVKMDPLLSVGAGDDNNILDLEVAGEDGLLDLDLLGQDSLLNLGGDGPLLNLGGKDKGLLGLGGVLRRSAKHGNQRLLDVDVGGKKDKDQATIDVDVATHSKRQDKGLLDLQLGGYQDDKESTIDVDLLTRPRPDGNNGGNNGGNGGNGNNGGNNGGNGGNGGYLSHYQPLCKKGFKAPHRDQAEKCHARDANHCLAICHSRSALLTLEADAKVGDIANIQLCAAIEFNNGESGDNCHYFVAPEHEPCHDDELEEKENCYTFVRN